MKLSLIAILLISGLCAESLINDTQMQKIDTFDKNSIQRTKSQKNFVFMEESQYTVTDFYDGAKKDVSYTEEKMKNVDHHIDIYVIKEYEKQISNLQNRKRSPSMETKLKQLKILVAKKKSNLKKEK